MWCCSPCFRISLCSRSVAMFFNIFLEIKKSKNTFSYRTTPVAASEKCFGHVYFLLKATAKFLILIFTKFWRTDRIEWNFSTESTSISLFWGRMILNRLKVFREKFKNNNTFRQIVSPLPFRWSQNNINVLWSTYPNLPLP